jgi:hypothetical protein
VPFPVISKLLIATALFLGTCVFIQVSWNIESVGMRMLQMKLVRTEGRAQGMWMYFSVVPESDSGKQRWLPVLHHHRLAIYGAAQIAVNRPSPSKPTLGKDYGHQ